MSIESPCDMRHEKPAVKQNPNGDVFLRRPILATLNPRLSPRAGVGLATMKQPSVVWPVLRNATNHVIAQAGTNRFIPTIPQKGEFAPPRAAECPNPICVSSFVTAEVIFPC
jgi:hypothetical protein